MQEKLKVWLKFSVYLCTCMFTSYDLVKYFNQKKKQMGVTIFWFIELQPSWRQGVFLLISLVH